MIRVWGSFILATALSYWTVGFLGLRVFRDVLRWPFHDADQATTTAILGSRHRTGRIARFAARTGNTVRLRLPSTDRQRRRGAA